MTKQRVKMVIEGRVQGVFFRQSTVETARDLEITGWVRNCSDGRVEGLFEGEKRALQELIDWCRQGPPAAVVTDLDLDWQEYTGEFGDIRIRY